MPLRDPSTTVASDDKDSALCSELAGLQKQQWEALEHATYVGMTAEQAREYEHRARRINLKRESKCAVAEIVTATLITTVTF